MALRYAEGSLSLPYLHAHGCLGLPASYIDDLSYDQVGYPAGPGGSLVCCHLFYPESYLKYDQLQSEHNCSKDQSVAAGHPLLMGELVAGPDA